MNRPCGYLVTWVTRSSIICAAVLGCSAEAAQTRVEIRSNWDTVWYRRSGLQDTTLVAPIGMLVLNQRLIVLDRGAPRVSAFDTKDGSLLWSVGQRGSGPEEFREPFSMGAVDSGQVAVLDMGNTRTTFVTEDGVITKTEPNPNALVLYTECQLGDARVGAAFAPDSQFALIGVNGQVQRRFGLPWRDFKGRSPLLQQVMLAKAGDDLCIAAGVRAGGVALLSRDGILRSKLYVEAVSLPQVTRTGDMVQVRNQVDAGRDVAVSSDTVFVLFGGVTPLAGRVVDLYDTMTLRYLGSIVLPTTAVKIAVDESIFYVLRMRSGTFEVMALRRRPS